MKRERRLFSHCPDNYFVGGYWVGTYSIEFKIRSKLKTGFWKWNSNPKNLAHRAAVLKPYYA